MISSVLVGLAALAGYLALTPPVSGAGDAPEFTIALARCGLVHPTGYPLYTLVGHLFCRVLHAFGAPWGLAANAWSGVGAASAVALFHALAKRLADPGPPVVAGRGLREAAALLPAALLALNPLVLLEATNAEVNTWALAWSCAMGLLFLAGLARVGEAAGERPALPLRSAAGWGLLCGVGLAHHLTSIWISATLSLALAVAARRRLRPGHVAAALAGAVLPVLSYGFVAWRIFHPAPGQWPAVVRSLTGILDHVTAARYTQLLGFFAPAGDQRVLLATGVYPFLFPGIALLLAAWARAGTTDRRVAWWGFLGATLVVMLFGFQYGVPDPAPYFLPAVAFGLLGIPPLVAELGSMRRIPAIARIAGFALALAAVGALSVGWVRGAIREKETSIRYDRVIHGMWSMVRADSGIVAWSADQHFRLVEYQVLRGEKPGLLVINPDLLIEPQPRIEVLRRFGVDPLEGVALPRFRPDAPNARRIRDRTIQAILRGINERSPCAVVLFDPTVPMVRQLPKP